jgi:hypothetical protein
VTDRRILVVTGVSEYDKTANFVRKRQAQPKG